MAGDRVFGLLIAVVALGYILSATQIQLGFLSDPVGSRTFPYIVGGVALLCGLAIAARPGLDPEWPAWRALGRIGLTLAVLYLFAIALRPLGFLIPAALASASLAYLVRPDARVAAAAGLGLSVGLFAILKYALGLGLAPFGRMLTG